MILSFACLWEIVRSVVSHNFTRVALIIQSRDCTKATN